jgi:hypothetical protein
MASRKRRVKKRRRTTRAALEKQMGQINEMMKLGFSQPIMRKLERHYHKVEKEWAKKLNAERKAFDKKMGTT